MEDLAEYSCYILGTHLTRCNIIFQTTFCKMKVSIKRVGNHNSLAPVHPCGARRVRRRVWRLHRDAGGLDQTPRQLEHLHRDAEVKPTGMNATIRWFILYKDHEMIMVRSY